MESAERQAFLKLLIAAGELYNRQVSDVLVKLYWQILHPFPFLDVQNAFEIHFSDPDAGQFMPKPADIIRVIKGNNQSQSLQAWSKVEQAIRIIGPYQTVVFDDEVIHAVLQEMGGWIKICQISQKEAPFVAKEFQTRYTAYRYKPPTTYPKALTGITTHQNALRGHKTDTPCLIGDAHKAKLVLEHGSSGSIVIKISDALPKYQKAMEHSKTEGAYARTTKAISQA